MKTYQKEDQIPRKYMNLKPNDSFIDQVGGKTYRVNSQIGFGTYGIVYLVEEVLTNQKYALKLQNQITQQELNLLEMLVKRRFTNLVNTISFGQYQNRYPYSVMEYCRENLYETITQKGTITNEQFRYVAHQIATGLKELHDLGLIHRDIKPENIMQFDHVDEVTKKVQKTYKICDFGLVMQQDSAKTQFSGTPYYIAPEQLQKEAKNYTNKVDIWALGAVFFELVQGWPLFQARTQEQIYDLIKKSEIDDKINKLDLKLEYKLLIRDMLNRESRSRPDINEIKKRLLPIIRSVSVKPTQQQQQQQQQQSSSQQKYSQTQAYAQIQITKTNQPKPYIYQKQTQSVHEQNQQQKVQIPKIPITSHIYHKSKNSQINHNIMNMQESKNINDKTNSEKQNASPRQNMNNNQSIPSKIHINQIYQNQSQISNQFTYYPNQYSIPKQPSSQIKPNPIQIISKQSSYSAPIRKK